MSTMEQLQQPTPQEMSASARNAAIVRDDLGLPVDASDRQVADEMSARNAAIVRLGGTAVQ